MFACHIFGSKISKDELPTFFFFGGGGGGVKIFSNCHFLSVQSCNTSKIVPCYQIFD